jgi:peptidoglycan/xylan/chitin deacetylase (PgdA/CDA1 family)
LNAKVCDHEPEIVEAGVERDWEFMAHGETNAQRLSGLEVEEERDIIRKKISGLTGTPPTGWLGPGLTETFNTVDLLADEGFSYVADWCNDEQPYPIDTETGNPLSLPYTLEMNDVPMYLNYNLTPTEYERAIKEQFDVLYEEGSRSGNGKVMAIALHDYLSGHPHRSMHLDNVLEYITGHDDVWMTTGREIADHYSKNYGE